MVIIAGYQKTSGSQNSSSNDWLKKGVLNLRTLVTHKNSNSPTHSLAQRIRIFFKSLPNIAYT